MTRREKRTNSKKECTIIMPKIISNAKYTFLTNKINEYQENIGNLQTKEARYQMEIRAMESKIEELEEKLKEEGEKYKKYVKQMRQKTNESAKKWLNGYPDE